MKTQQLIAIILTILIMVVLLKVVTLVMAGIFALARLVIVLAAGYVVYQVIIRVLKEA